jgi:ubiquinone/menaquinone biosynthesis C-methylase UbiE/biotin carboxylase
VKPVTVVFPTLWDRKQIASLGAAGHDVGDIAYTAPDDLDCPDDLDVLGFIDDLASRMRDARDAAVTSSSDYPGAVVAAAVAADAGLPGATTAAILCCSNKYAARQAMQSAVPEATPAFALVHAHASRPTFPCFLKPVRGAFSAHSTVVADQAQLDAFLARPAIADYTRDYLRLHHRLQARYAPDLPDASAFLVEEILHGVQLTVEAFAHERQVTILGVVDSILHPGTRSFARFEYPSALSHEVQQRMHDITRRAARALGLDRTLFNIEMMYDAATDRIGILEVNPRMCGQFADLYDKVDGTHGYAVALALARGEQPQTRSAAGRYAHAASFPLRVFAPTRVRRAPDARDVAAAEALYPGTLVWVECATGDTLCDFDSIEDGASVRYAVINVGAPTREALVERARAVEERLRFTLEPVAAEPTRRLAAEYGATAPAYAAHWAPVIAPMAQPLIDALASASPGARCVIDLGCGTGSQLPRLRAAFPQAALAGVDRSEGMVRMVDQAGQRAAHTTAPALAVMDAQALALANEIADVALLAFVLFHLPDPTAGLREARRILRAGGLCGAVTWAATAEEPWNAIWREELDAHGAVPDPRDAAVVHHDLMDTQEKLAALFEQAGFTRIEAWHEDFAHRWTVAALLQMQTRCGMPARRAASLPPAAQSACRKQVAARLAALSPEQLVARPRVVLAVGHRDD